MLQRVVKNRAWESLRGGSRFTARMMSYRRLFCKSGDKTVAGLNVFVPVWHNGEDRTASQRVPTFHFGGPAGPRRHRHLTTDSHFFSKLRPGKTEVDSDREQPRSVR
jgi:hypothetical protein